MDFGERYKLLNTAQRDAVDTIDGPVIVLAGPGTGKTELLSVRAANILQKTDALPENILCLTFTDSGATAIHNRLTEIIGKDAYRVSVQTFHSFGSEIINQNNEYFYNSASFRAASDINTYEILRSILDDLPHDNPLSSKHGDEYVHLKDIKQAISNIKKAGLTSDELLAILDANDESLDSIERSLTKVFDIPRINAGVADQLMLATEETVAPTAILPIGVTNLLDMIMGSISRAYEESLSTSSTKPITAWRNKWMEKNVKNEFVFKNRKIQSKLRATCYVYYRYITELERLKLYDYDDMILQVVHAMEVNDDLRFNLQEKYQYIMVDEFQDSNLAQTRIVHSLANNPVNEGKPNILVVGDDDQAIYGFQGADSSNILDFRTEYPTAKLIVLTENYRSTKPILEHARSIIIQGEDRLENSIAELSKQLSANFKYADTSVRLYEHLTPADEYSWIAQSAKELIEKGVEASEITVLARKHAEIINLLPYFQQAGIDVKYERFDNALDLGPIIALEELADVLIDLNQSRHKEANAKLPKLLSHPAWNIQPSTIWKVSSRAYDAQKRWLDAMEQISELQPIRDWIINTSTTIMDVPLEQAIDALIGKTSDIDNVVSPFYNYYFSAEKLANEPTTYITYLEALKAIRTKLRDYQTDQQPNLMSFTDFLRLHRQLDIPVQITRSYSPENKSAVNLMTAHKSKGLEFDHVYITGAVDSAWGQKVRARHSSISFPENLHLEPAGNSADERIRLFYVAATRARKTLTINYARSNPNGKSLDKADFLVSDIWQTEVVESSKTLQEATHNLETEWYSRVIEPKQELRLALAEAIDVFKLSPTALGNFTDITRGGPQYFLMQTLLHFPQAPSASASFGTAIHHALQQAHNHLAATGNQKPTEDIIKDFEDKLISERLVSADHQKFLQRGIDTLQAFLANKHSTFTKNQLTELKFDNQNSVHQGVQLSGKLDLVAIDKINKTIEITDYKTGKPTDTWQGKDDTEKVKLHKYRQQLMFYDILINNSRDYQGYEITKSELQFVEPDKSGRILSIQSDYTAEQLEEFKKLVVAVWSKIKTFDFPDISDYPKNYKGVLQFEQALIDNLT